MKRIRHVNSVHLSGLSEDIRVDQYCMKVQCDEDEHQGHAQLYSIIITELDVSELNFLEDYVEQVHYLLLFSFTGALISEVFDPYLFFFPLSCTLYLL